MRGVMVGLLALALGLPGAVRAEAVGEVDTSFRWLGPDNKIVVQVFDDPRVGGVSCYLSRAKTGGFKGAVGLAEDTSDASVACRQVGEIRFNGPLPKQEEVFTERSSVFFKRVRVVRMVDTRRNALVYLVYSDRLVDGSPKNSVTAVAVPQSLRIPLR